MLGADGALAFKCFASIKPDPPDLRVEALALLNDTTSDNYGIGEKLALQLA